MHTRFIELAGEINCRDAGLGGRQDRRRAQRARQGGQRQPVLVLGIAYKKNVDDMRESPSVELMELLQEKGARDRLSAIRTFRCFPTMREHAFRSEERRAHAREHRAAIDCVLLATDHDGFDYALIRQSLALIVDTRGRYLEPAANVVKA